MEVIPNAPPPDAEGEDMGVGNADDFGLDTSYEFMKPESKPMPEEDGTKRPTTAPPGAKKDTARKVAPRIGEATEEKKEKKGILRRVFGGKEKDEAQNDY
jgi:penicillin-binding protein 1A